jgi:hypothetical protein
MEEEKDIRTPSRHHGSASRPKRLELSFSEDESKEVEALARKAGEGKHISSFVRKCVLGGGVVEAGITPTDRKDIAQLGKLGSNLWQLRKDLNRFGVDYTFTRDLESFYKELQTIVAYYKDKLQGK